MDHVFLPSTGGIHPIDVVYAPVYLARQHASRKNPQSATFREYWQRYSNLMKSSKVGSMIAIEEGYWGLPELMGFDRGRLLRGDFREKSPEMTLALLADWLYFGMLEEVTRHRFVVDKFLVKKHVPRQKGLQAGKDLVVLSTKFLPSLLQGWWNSLLESDTDQKKLMNSSMNACLADVWRLTTEHADAFATLCPPLGEQTHFAIAILGELLQETKQRIWANHRAYQDSMYAHIYTGINTGKDVLGQVRWGPSPLVRSRMLDNGWCKAEISRLETILPVLGVYYASFLRPSKPREQHQDCSDEFCTLSIVNESTYETQHRDGCNSLECKSIPSPIEKVNEILRSGGIPLIKLSRPKATKDTGQSLNFELDVVNAKSEKMPKYIAISHVWTDGLGDTTGNSLPACQLDRLEGFITELLLKEDSEDYDFTSFGKAATSVKEYWNHLKGAPCYFWMDTMCIPRGAEEETRKLRQDAIKRMAETYEGAYRVLVIDKELLNLDLTSRDEEIIMRVTCSGWMRRMWTLQEAYLGAKKSRLYVQCKAGPFNLYKKTISMKPENMHHEIVAVYNRSTQPVPYEMWKQNRLYDFGVYIRNPVDCHIRDYWANVYQIHLSKGADRFMHVWNETRWRTASHEEDRPYVVGTLMGLNTLPILDVEDLKDKMVVFFMLLETVPANILFLSGPRIRQDRMAWAPAKFSKFERVNVNTDHKGFVTDNGLDVFLPGWVLRARESPLILDEQSQFIVLEGGRVSTVTICESEDERKGKSSIQCFLPRPGSCHAIIFEIGNPMEIKQIPKGINDSRRGILVELNEITTRGDSTKEIVVVSYRCAVNISEFSFENDFADDESSIAGSYLGLEHSEAASVSDSDFDDSNLARVETAPLVEANRNPEATHNPKSEAEDELESEEQSFDRVLLGSGSSSDGAFVQTITASQNTKYMRWWRVG